MAEDLFQDSTMTFGEHLDELRAHMIRAIIGLFVGFLICLAFGDKVVDVIAYPVVSQLTAWKKRADQVPLREIS